MQKEYAMSDNLRRYRAIRDAFIQGYPGQPSGIVARHWLTLAALISGIVGSKNTQLPHIAAQVPNGTQPESRVKRFARCLDNARIREGVYFLPYEFWPSLGLLAQRPSCRAPHEGAMQKPHFGPFDASHGRGDAA